MTLMGRGIRGVENWKKRKQYYQKEEQKSSRNRSVESVQRQPAPINLPDVERVQETVLKSSKTKKPHRYLRYFLFGFGWVVAFIGIFLSIMWPPLTKQFLQKTLALTPDSEVYNKWVETPIPIYFKMYMFNWTNPETSLRGPDKPAFEQLGPYVFLKHQVKRDIVWNDNGTITYLIEDQYKHFIPEMSNGSLSDKLTNVNVIPMIIGWYCRHCTWFEKTMVNYFMTATGSSLIKTDTVGNLLFDGSDDPILDILNKFKPFIKSLPLTDKFGYLYKQNYSTATDGVYTMKTGAHDITSLGLASAWNYKNHTVLSGECGRVQGSFNELYPPDSYHQDQLMMFGFPLCSAGPVYRDGFSSISGIPTAIYVGKADSFSNETACFCPPNDPCPPSGAHDVSQCQGVPFFMSWPHFYLADDVYRDSIVGMNPDPAMHQTRFELSDVTAATLKGRFKMQINFPLQSIKGMSLFNGVQKVVVPIFWTSQEADLTQDMMDEMYWLVIIIRCGRWPAFVVGLLGLLLVIVGAVLKYRGYFR